MKISSAALLTAILAALIVATGAALRSDGHVRSPDSYCPAGGDCSHSVGHPASLQDSWHGWKADARHWFFQAEQALLQQSGYRGPALR